jgi:hypothetical protein
MVMHGPFSIGAGFRIEGRLASDDPAAEPRHHLGDDVIFANSQALADNLQRQVAVAEMPGDPQQARPVAGLNLDNRLGRGAHADIAAAVEFEPVAVGEMLGARQIEKKGGPRIGDEANAAAVPVEINQSYLVDRSIIRPLTAGMDSNSPPHRPAQYKK